MLFYAYTAVLQTEHTTVAAYETYWIIGFPTINH